MKIRASRLLSGFGLAVAGVFALGVAQAQNVPEQYVVTGKAAEKIQEFSTINLATAERIAESCEKPRPRRACRSASSCSIRTATTFISIAWTARDI